MIEQIKLFSLTLTAKKWITQTKVIGLISNQENNGSTLAHIDIAFNFKIWLNPEKRYEVVKR